MSAAATPHSSSPRSLLAPAVSAPGQASLTTQVLLNDTRFISTPGVHRPPTPSQGLGWNPCEDGKPLYSPGL